MMKRSLSTLPVLHVRRYSCSEMLGLVFPSYLMMLLDAQKHLGKHSLRTLLTNTLSPGPSGLRLCHSRSLCLP
jgi:hypothetical protein